MADLTEKPWGWSTMELANLFCEVHRIDVLRGGHCSWHKHTRKDNVFTAAQGRLVIEYHTWDDITQLVLLPGETCVVPAGTVHRFRAPFEAVRAMEVYFPSFPDQHLGGEDIIRYSQGGLDSTAGGNIN